MTSLRRPLPLIALWLSLVAGLWGPTAQAATYVVDLDEGGDFISIQAAINAATGGDVIEVLPGTYYEALNFNGKAITVFGREGAERTILDGEGSRQLVQFRNGETRSAALSGFTLRRGYGSTGGGIYIYNASPSLSNLRIEDCVATNYGGGIFIEGGSASPLISQSRFERNVAQTYGGGLALWRYSRAAITQSRFFENSATNAGGAIYSYYSDLLRLENSLLVHNEAYDGGALYSNQSTFDLSQNTLVGNTAVRGGQVYQYYGDGSYTGNILAFAQSGGGIYLYGGAATYEYNDAFGNDGGEFPYYGLSGAGNLNLDPLFLRYHPIDEGDHQNLRLDPLSPCVDMGVPGEDDLDGSPADMGAFGGLGADPDLGDRDGDGLSDDWELDNGLSPTDPTDGDGDQDGDGLTDGEEFLLGGDPTRTDTDGDGIDDAQEAAEETSLYDDSDHRPVADAGVNLVVERGGTAQLDGSASSDPNGDALTYLWQVESAPEGSAVDAGSISDATAASPTFTPDVRGVYTLSLTVHDGLVSSDPDTIAVQLLGDIYVPEDFELIQDAIAAADDGDDIYVGPGTYTQALDLDGKRIRLISTDGPEVTILDGGGARRILLVNSGEEEGTALIGFTLRRGYGSYGGAVYVSGSALQIEGCRFEENRATSGGGDLYGQSSATVTIRGTSFRGGSAPYGGAIYSTSTQLSLEEIEVEGATSTYEGGGIYLYYGSASLVRVRVLGNATGDGRSGGGLYSQGTSLGVHNSLFKDNVAHSGSALYAYSGTLTLHNNTWLRNQANTQGQVTIDRSTAYVRNNLIADGLGGGGIWTYYSSLTAFSNNDIYGNVGGDYVGALPDQEGISGNLSEPPHFAYDRPQDSEVALLLPTSESPLRDAGVDESAYDDPPEAADDARRNDIGYTGGPLADPAFHRDSDADGMVDAWEIFFGLDPEDGTDADLDPDGDALTSLEEEALGTSPVDADTDDDGVSDSDELSSGELPLDETDNRPVADAGSPVQGPAGSSISLTGSGVDPKGLPLTFAWSLVSVPEISAITDDDLTDADAATVSFTPDAPGRYLFQLVVSNGAGFSRPDTVVVDAVRVLRVPEGGYASIQAAIEEANDGDTILVAPGTYRESLDFLGKAIRLVGEEGAASTFLDGQNSRRLIILDSAEPDGAELVGFTLHNGRDSLGAAVYMKDAHLRVESCVFRDGYAYSYGGAIQVDGGVLSVEDTVFHDNRSGTYAAAIYALGGADVSASNVQFNDHRTQYGGAIFVDGSVVSIMDAVFESNEATYQGGAIYLASGSSYLSIQDSRFLMNTSSRHGGAIYGSSGTMRLVRDEFLDNRVTHSSYSGGAIAMEYGTLVASNLLIARNSAGYGGGIYRNSGLSTFENLTLLDNGASTADGQLRFTYGAHTLTNSIVGLGQGAGGIYSYSSTELTLTYNDVYGNEGGDYLGNLSDLTGLDGNVSVDPSFAALAPIDDSEPVYLLTSESPLRDLGDPAEEAYDPEVAGEAHRRNDMGYTGGPEADPRFFLDTDGDGLVDAWEQAFGLDPENGTDAAADGDGDGLTALQEEAAGTLIGVADSDGDGLSDGEELDLGLNPLDITDARPTAFAGDDAEGALGEAITLSGSGEDPNGDPLTYAWSFAALPPDSALGDGDITDADTSAPSFTPDIPGFYTLELIVSDPYTSSLPDQVVVHVNGTWRVPEDKSTISAAIAVATSGDRILVGPGTYSETLSFDGKTLSIESVEGAASTILEGNNGRQLVVVIEGSEEGTALVGFTLQNGRSYYGGAISVASGTLQVSGCRLKNNYAYYNGGGLYATSATVEVRDSEFVGNRGGQYGGGLFVSSSSTLIQDTTFTQNYTSSYDGGALYSDGSGTLDVVSSSLRENRAGRYGGAIRATGGYLNLTDTDLLYNRALRGGAVLTSTTSRLNRLRILGNRATDAAGAGGIQHSGATLTLRNSLVSANQGYEAGAILSSSGYPYFENNVIVGNRAITGLGALALWVDPASIRGNVIAFNEGGGVRSTRSSLGAFAYNDLYENEGGDWLGTWADLEDRGTNVSVDPEFTDYSDNAQPLDDLLTLLSSSALKDGGDPDEAYEDPDGSYNDVGVYGGPGADALDLDRDGVAWDGGDCDDRDPHTFAGALEWADGADNDCDGSVDEDLGAVDVDGDGFTAAEGDCDDSAADIYPEAEESGNALDDDCDGRIDESTAYVDDDGDGYWTFFGDCDDGNAEAFPGAEEICNEIDDDCDGSADDGVLTPYWVDADGDGYGDDHGRSSGEPPADPDGYGCEIPDGYAGTTDDCDDSSALSYPGAEEIRDFKDNNCNGRIDETFVDDDLDGYTENQGDCDDEVDTIYPGAPEGVETGAFGCAIADGIDNDCDDDIDEDTCGTDDDGDGFTELEGDCGDGNAAVYPGAPETWIGGLDYDCDGVVGPGDPDATTSTLYVSPNEILSDGAALATVTVIPRNDEGELLGPGRAVVIETTLGTLLDGVSDHGDGTYTQVFQAPDLEEGGEATLSASVDGIALAQAATLTFVGDTTAPETRITGGPTNGRAITETSVTYTFAGSDDSIRPLNFQHRLDGGDWTGFSAETTATYGDLALGAHTFEVQARDFAGNVDPSPATRSITISPLPDEVTPAVDPEGTGTALSLSWAGYPETNDLGATVAYYEIYAAQSPFALFESATRLGTSAAGQQAFVATGLPRGQESCVSVAAVFTGDVRRAGVTAPEAQPCATPVDVVAPEAITAPRVASTRTSLTFSWTRSVDSAGDVAVQWITLSDGGGTLALDPSTTAYSVEELPYASSRTATLSVGDGESPRNVSPAVEIAGITLLDSPDDIHTTPANSRVHLTWSAPEPSALIAHYNVYVSATDFTTTQGKTPALTGVTDLEATVTGLTNELTHYFAVTTVNLSGGESTQVTTASAAPISDADPPVISAVLVDGEPLLDGFTLDGPATLTVNATDAESGIDRVVAQLGPAALGADTQQPFTFAIDPLLVDEDGDYSLVIQVFDGRGNVATASRALRIRLAPPLIPSLTSPPDGVEIFAEAVDVEGVAEAGVEILLQVNGAFLPVVVADGAGAFTVAQVPLVEGSNLLKAKARNRAGTSALSPGVVVIRDTVGPEAPSLPEAFAQSGGRVRLSWRAPEAGETPAAYRIYRSDAVIAELTGLDPVAPSVASLSFTDTPPEDGRWYYAITALDAAGNEGAPALGASATSDGTPPSLIAATLTSTGALSGEIFGQSEHLMTLTVSEPLQGTPYVAIFSSLGIPVSIAPLERLGETGYLTRFSITDAVASGPLYLNFSGQDRLGNRGTAVTADFPWIVDTTPPSAAVVIDPTEPIPNDPEDPTTLAVELTLTEALAEGTEPTLTLNSRYRSVDEPVALTQVPGEPLRYTGNHTLHPSVGELPGDSVGFGFRATDLLGNVGDDLTQDERYEVFQGELPPSAAPTGLTALALPGGEVRLSWREVPGAAAYEIYRAAPGEEILTAIGRSAELGITDTPYAEGAGEGIFEYAVASVRQEVGLESIGELSNIAQVNVDATPPLAPEALLLELQPYGVLATWEPADADSFLYAFIRAEVPTTYDLSEVVLDTLIEPLAVDVSPSSFTQFYSVVAFDRAGNMSEPAEWVDINLDQLPVRDIVLYRKWGEAPVLTWSHESQVLQGYAVRALDGDEEIPLHDGLLPFASFVDEDLTEGGRTYQIVAVDGEGVESLPRVVRLPPVEATLPAESILYRGVINGLDVVVSNEGDEDWRASSITLVYLDKTVSAGGGIVPAQDALLAHAIVGGEAALPAQAGVDIQLYGAPEPGVEVFLDFEGAVDVLDRSLPLTLYSDELVRGATGAFRFSLRNTGPEALEILTAASDTAASSEVRLRLKDEEGNVLTQAAMAQRTGGVIRTTGGAYMARVEAGGTFTSEALTFDVPPSLPDAVVAELSIDRVHSDVGGSEDVTAAGPRQTLSVQVESLPYGADLTEVGTLDEGGAFVAQSRFMPGERIVLRGEAWPTENPDNPMPYVPITVYTQVKGKVTPVEVVSDLEGRFTVSFDASLPGLYRGWASHPEGTSRPIEAEWEVSDLYVSPSLYRLTLGHGNSYTYRVNVTNPGEATLAGVAVEPGPLTQSGGAEADGVLVEVLTAPGDIGPGRSRGYDIRVSVTEDAPAQAQGVLSIVTVADGLTWATTTLELSTQGAQATLVSAPTSLRTGLNPGDIQTLSITLSNKGLATASGVEAALIAESGHPLPSWMSLASVTDLGDLAVGASVPVGVRAAPGDQVADGVYYGRLRITSADAAGGEIPIAVTVTTSETGNGTLHLVDAYYGTEDEHGDTIYGVNGASVTLQHATVPGVVFTASSGSDNLGTATFTGIPAARYNYRGTAPGYQEVSGTIDVRPGVDTSVRHIMELAPISYEFTVTETTVEDSYTIVLTAQYQTDVPVPVIVMEPAGIRLSDDMEVGDEIIVEYALTNHGLVRGEDLRINIPSADGYFDYTLLTPIPDSIEAKERLTFLMRIHMHSDGTEATGAVSCGGANLSARANYCSCPPDCADGPNASTGSGSSINYGTCSGGGSSTPSGGGTGGSGGGGGGGGGGFGGGGPTTSLSTDDCLYLWGEPTDGDDEDCAASSVHLSTGQYEDSVVDLFVEANGPDLRVARTWAGAGAPGGAMGAGWNLEGTFDRLYKTSQDPAASNSVHQGMEDYTSARGSARLGGMRMWCGGSGGGCASLSPDFFDSDFEEPDLPEGEEGEEDDASDFPLAATSDGGCGGGGGGASAMGYCSGGAIARFEDMFAGDFDYGAEGGEAGGTQLVFTSEDFEAGTDTVLTLENHRGQSFTFGPLNETDVNYPVVGADRTRLELLRGGDGVVDGVLWREPSGDWRKFNVDGRLVAEGDRLGNTLELLYDGEGRLSRMESVNDRSIFIAYHYEDGARPERLTGISDWRGRTVDYAFGEDGQLSSVTDVRGGAWSYLYDTKKRVTYKESPEGDGVHIAYRNEGAQVESVTWESVEDRQMLGKLYERFEGSDGTTVTRVTSSEGRWYEAGFNVFGQLSHIVTPAGTLLTREYTHFDEQGTIRRITERRRDGSTWVTEQDTLGRMTRTVDPYGGAWTYTYPSAWETGADRPTKVVDPRGTETRILYDDVGNPATLTFAAGTADELVLDTDFDDAGNMVALYLPGDVDGQPTYEWAYNDQGLLTRRGERLSASQINEETFAYAYANGRRTITYTDGDGFPWIARFNEAEQLVEVADGSSGEVYLRNTFDADGRLIESAQFPERAEESRTLSQDYEIRDLVKRLERVEEAGESASQISYDDDGKPTALIDRLGRITQLVYNSTGQLQARIDEATATELFTYDPLTPACAFCSLTDVDARPQTYTDPRGGTVSLVYDLKGRVAQEIDEEGRVTAFEYDAIDRVTRTLLGDGSWMAFAYDRLDRIIEVTRGDDEDSRRQHLVYDARGDLSAIYVDDKPLEPLFQFERFQNGWVKTEIRATGSVLSYTYNGRGMVASVLNADGTASEFDYNRRGWLAEARYFTAQGDETPGETLTYGYDAYGQVTSWGSGDVSGAFTRDRLGRLTGGTVLLPGGVEKSFAYTWNAADTVASYTNPEGEAFTYGYAGPRDVLASITDGAGQAITFEAYDWVYPGRIAWPNGQVQTLSFDLDGRWDAVSYEDGEGQSVFARDYDYDLLGRVDRFTEGGGLTQVGYHLMGGITGYIGPDVSEVFTYTEGYLANRETSSETGEATWNYNGGGQLAGYGDVAYEYDLAGQPLVRTVNGETDQVYRWSARHRLAQVEDGDGAVLGTYTYDAFGRRVSKTVEGVTTYFVYSDRGLIGEYSADGTAVRTYGWMPREGGEAGGGLSLELGKAGFSEGWGGSPIWMKTEGTVFFYLTDYLGSVVAMTDLDGVVVWKCFYASSVRNILVDEVQNPLGLPGQYSDEESGLIYNAFRYYIPSEGRYLSSDPVGLGGGQLSLYSYANFDSVNGTDRFGLWGSEGHDKIMDYAFPEGDPRHDSVERLKDSSKSFDFWSNIFNSGDTHYHSMRDPGQDPGEAIRMRDEFIRQKICEARALHQQGDDDAALKQLGVAMHTIMDSSSPLHTDADGHPQEWDWGWDNVKEHGNTGGEEAGDVTQEVLDDQRERLNDAFDQVFGEGAPGPGPAAPRPKSTRRGPRSHR